jgi:cell division septation protein DedD
MTLLNARLLDALIELDAREREEAAYMARENQETTESLAQLTNRLLDALMEREARDIEEARLAREAREREEAARIEREREEAARLAREWEREEAARIARDIANVNPAQPANPPQTNPANPANPAAQVQPMELNIIPRLPDPNNGKVYYLQVGSFANMAAAMDVSQKVINAGFDVFQVFNGFAYRVLVKDIPASMVDSAAQRLNAIGIREIWLRER